METLSTIWGCFLCGIVFTLLLLSGQECSTLKKFEKFVQKYGRTYKPGSKEYAMRFHIFQKNVEKSKLLNLSSNHSSAAVYGVSKFSDLTEAEFTEQYLSDLQVDLPDISHGQLKFVPWMGKGYTQCPPSGLEDVPKKIDWRTQNIVTPVKNQKSCGACWAFATVETVESLYALHHPTLEVLSVQEMIDCSAGYTGLYACKGGNICQAYDWMVKRGVALVTEAQYPLTDTVESCHIRYNQTVGVSITSYACHTGYVGAECQILRQLAQGPVAVSVDATNWNNYMGGVIQYHCGTANNHAVMLVGYDLTGPIPFYIAKNSWGADWGNQGYVYIKYGDNVCGVAQQITYPSVRSSS